MLKYICINERTKEIRKRQEIAFQERIKGFKLKGEQNERDGSEKL